MLRYAQYISDVAMQGPYESVLATYMHGYYIARGRSCNILPVIMLHAVRFEAFTAVTMKNAVFWDVTPCDSCTN
jgi:hypothetical protein